MRRRLLLYVNVLNRAPADVYIVQRGTAVSAVYGTVTINSNYALTLFSQNAGYLHQTARHDRHARRASPSRRTNSWRPSSTRSASAQRQPGAQRLRGRRFPPTGRAEQRSGRSSPRRTRSTPTSGCPTPTPCPRSSATPPQNEVNRLTGIVDNEKLELQRAVDATASALKATEDQLKRTEIRAPFDGILTAANFNDNAYVLPNQALFTVATTETYVSGQVNEEDVGQLKHGHEGRGAPVRLRRHDLHRHARPPCCPAPTPNSSRYTVTLALDHPPDNLMFGETGEMNIILGRKENALIIPARALQVDQVLIVEDGIVEQRTVKVGFKSLEFAEILDGLNERRRR